MARHNDDPCYNEVDAIILEIGYDLIPLFDNSQYSEVHEQIRRLRQQLAKELGFGIPKIRIVDHVGLELSEYCIYINANGDKHIGYMDADDPTIIIASLKEIIKRNSADIFGLQDTQNILDKLRKKHPIIVDEVMKENNDLGVVHIWNILRGLLKENVSIRNMPSILEAVTKNVHISTDIRFLIEQVRQALSGQICSQYAKNNCTIHVMTLDPTFEQKIIDGKAQTSTGDMFSVLEPALHDVWVKALEKSVQAFQDQGHDPIILCTGQARYLVKTIIDREFSEVVVLSVSEISNDFNVESIGTIMSDMPRETGSEESSKNMDILDHIEKVVEIAQYHGIEKCQHKGKKHINYISEKLDIKPLQTVLFSLMMENASDNNIILSKIARSVKSSKVRVIKYMTECEELEKKKLIRCRRNDDYTSYRIPRDVKESLVKYNEYRPEKNENLSISKFFSILEKLFKEREKDELTFETLTVELLDLVNKNMHLEFCKKIMSYNLDQDDLILLMCFCNLSGNNNDDFITIREIAFLYDVIREVRDIESSLACGDHVLIEKKFVDFNNNGGFVNNESWRLSNMAKKELLSELSNRFNRNNKKNLILFDTIKEKKLFFNPRETKEIETLASLLSEVNYRRIQDRLDGKGMRKGFACLFSGSPGTGKTETAYQIARETKRNIMMVNISETKSMWYGESEKRIKKIFDNYRLAVENSSTAPILLFNEADAVIGKRKAFSSGNHIIDQTENAIQNIILQEMENLNGIMIATTNLTQNMDKAFERRFLYKINFDRPGIESRKGIWNSLLPDLPEEKAIMLSGKFDLSGGQIENISRKIEVDAILHGDILDDCALLQYCKDEVKNSFNMAKSIGFNS